NCCLEIAPAGLHGLSNAGRPVLFLAQIARIARPLIPAQTIFTVTPAGMSPARIGHCRLQISNGPEIRGVCSATNTQALLTRNARILRRSPRAIRWEPISRPQIYAPSRLWPDAMRTEPQAK